MKRTYNGPLARGRVWLPTREVPFDRGTPVEFTAEEAGLLDELWSTPKATEAKPEKATEAKPEKES